MLGDLEIVDWIPRTLSSGEASLSVNDSQTMHFDILHENSVEIIPRKRY